MCEARYCRLYNARLGHTCDEAAGSNDAVALETRFASRRAGVVRALAGLALRHYRLVDTSRDLLHQLIVGQEARVQRLRTVRPAQLSAKRNKYERRRNHLSVCDVEPLQLGSTALQLFV